MNGSMTIVMPAACAVRGVGEIAQIHAALQLARLLGLDEARHHMQLAIDKDGCVLERGIEAAAEFVFGAR